MRTTVSLRITQAGERSADASIRAIVQRCEKLQTFAERGRRRDEIRPGLRTMGHDRSATIAFVVDHRNAAVTILGICHGGQDFAARLKD